MADEFNPQGVDQTPRNNETPNDTADAGNAEPKNPFVGCLLYTSPSPRDS